MKLTFALISITCILAVSLHLATSRTRVAHWVVLASAVIQLNASAEIDLGKLLASSDVIFVGAKSHGWFLKEAELTDADDLQARKAEPKYYGRERECDVINVQRILARNHDAEDLIEPNSANQFFVLQAPTVDPSMPGGESMIFIERKVNYLFFCRRRLVPNVQLEAANRENGRLAEMTTGSSLAFFGWEIDHYPWSQWGQCIHPVIAVEEFERIVRSTYSDYPTYDPKKACERAYHELRTTFGTPDVTPLLKELDVLLPILMQDEEAAKAGLAKLTESSNPRLQRAAKTLLAEPKLPRYATN